MGLIETLLIGSFLYTTAAFSVLYKKMENFINNHFRHLETNHRKIIAAIAQLAEKQGVELTEDSDLAYLLAPKPQDSPDAP